MGIDSDIPVVVNTGTELKNAETIEEQAKIFGQRYAQYENYAPFSVLTYLPPSGDNKTNGCSKLLQMIANNVPALEIKARIAANPEEVRAVSNQKWTALHMICVCGTEFMVRKASLVKIASILIQAGANINAQDVEGFTPLMRIVQWSAPIELFNVLMASMCDVNLKNNEGLTALHIYYARSGRNYRYVQPILDADFDINSTTNDGHTVLAVLTENTVTTDLLRMMPDPSCMFKQ